MRKHCSSVRQASPPRVALRSEATDWVATIGITRLCLVRAKLFSSPAGSSSPTVANCWYSSQTNTAGRK